MDTLVQTSWSHLHETLLCALRATAGQRSSRSDMTWIGREQQDMLRIVNEYRSGRGLPEVTEVQVFRAQLHATGRTDYAEKFATGCADLAVYGEFRER